MTPTRIESGVDGDGIEGRQTVKGRTNGTAKKNRKGTFHAHIQIRAVGRVSCAEVLVSVGGGSVVLKWSKTKATGRLRKQKEDATAEENI
jgi:hypothetical protein